MSILPELVGGILGTTWSGTSTERIAQENATLNQQIEAMRQAQIYQQHKVEMRKQEMLDVMERLIYRIAESKSDEQAIAAMRDLAKAYVAEKVTDELKKT